MVWKIPYTDHSIKGSISLIQMLTMSWVFFGFFFANNCIPPPHLPFSLPTLRVKAASWQRRATTSTSYAPPTYAWPSRSKTQNACRWTWTCSGRSARNSNRRTNCSEHSSSNTASCRPTSQTTPRHVPILASFSSGGGRVCGLFLLKVSPQQGGPCSFFVNVSIV